jgi:hypothetical protein
MGTTAAVIGLGLQAAGTFRELKAAEKSFEFQAQMNRNNAELKKERIKDIETVGAEAIKQMELDAVQISADQITAYAGAGVDISSAVVGERLEETALVATSDIMTVLNNIEKSVWGIETEIENDTQLALFNEARAKSAGKFAPIAAATGLLTGLGQLALLSQLQTKVPKIPDSGGTSLPRAAFPPTFDVTAVPF